MTQNLIVICIITIAVGYAIYSIIKNLTAKKKKKGCDGCADCDLKDKCK